MLVGFNVVVGCFEFDQLYVWVIEKCMKNINGIGFVINVCDDGVRQLIGLILDLYMCFYVDDLLEIVYYGWKWMWFGCSIKVVVGVVGVGNLILECFIDGVFECF